jgi:hypothetical protein
MAKRHATPEQIIAKLPEAEVLVAQDTTVAQGGQADRRHREYLLPLAPWTVPRPWPGVQANLDADGPPPRPRTASPTWAGSPPGQ